MKFNFGEYNCEVHFCREVPKLKEITAGYGNVLVVCDENTSVIADKICGSASLPRCLLKSGEDSKTWQSVQEILSAAHEAALGRDGMFIGIGGGVIGDLTGFAASVYMRGCRLALVSTTLLGMVDASVGGKTGFDIFGIKNLAGSFYPAGSVYIPYDCLSSLPEREIKSGMAELIKTAVIDGDDFLDELILLKGKFDFSNEVFCKCIERAVTCKGKIVTEDLKESGKRMLLNLGHTFGHALESCAGLGTLSHGEAVAWGMVRSCELGYALGVTPRARAEKIINLIELSGYEGKCPHPLAQDANLLLNAMNSDKKKKHGKLTFIVPGAQSAVPVVIESEKDLNTMINIINGGFSF